MLKWTYIFPYIQISLLVDVTIIFIMTESTVGHYKPGLWTGLDWMVDWTLDSIMDSIIGLEFGTPGLKGHRQSTWCSHLKVLVIGMLQNYSTTLPYTIFSWGNHVCGLELQSTQRLDYIHNSPQVDAGLAVLHQEDTWLVLCPLHTLYCNPTSGVRPANKWVCWEEERGTLAVTGINNSMKV